jgi:outer membrane protein OmpA-like peptidoglycan-associated protein
VLTATTKTALQKLAKQAKVYGTASSITIIGRVKETNDKSYDMRLSKQRATNVANYLKRLGVKGTYKVIAAGISPENKPISRRVDGTLIWK